MKSLLSTHPRSRDQVLAGFGRRLRAARISADLTRKELADYCGISYRTIGYFESGEREPLTSTLFAIAAKLQITPQELWEPQP